MARRKKIRLSKAPSFTAILFLCVFAVAAWKMGFGNKESINVSSIADGVLYVHYIDIGQGDSALITTPSGETALVDAGPKSSAGELVQYLEGAGVSTIDYLILSHPHEDHIGGATDVLECFDVKAVVMPDVTAQTAIFRTTLESVAEEECESILAEPGDNLPLGGAVFTILGPITTDEDDLNHSSIITKLTYQNTAFMFTGDAEIPAEKEALARFSAESFKSDVLKVGHHGSSTSTGGAFLRAVEPKIAVISCSLDNDYGHPHDEIVELFESTGLEYYRTDLDGSIVISSDGTSVKYIND